MQASTYFEENLKPKHKDAYWEDGKLFILNREGYELGHEINWLDDPYDHRSWRWLLNNFKWMDSLLYRYLRDGDYFAAKKSAEYFFSWYDFYVADGRKGEFLWKDDAVSFRAFRIAIVTRYILGSPDYSEEKKQTARDAIKLHYDELIDDRKFKRNNHGLFQVRGLMTISTIHSDILDLDAARAYVAKKVNYLWLQQYGKQGIHLENSTAYHQIIIKEFEEISKSPEFNKCKLIFNKVEIEKVKDNSKYFFHPNGKSTLFGDSNLSIQPHPRFSGDRIFNEAGYAFFSGKQDSEENSYLAVRTGFPSNIHRHSDDFSFEWSEKGQVIFQDSGRYSYEYNNPLRIFLTSTRAHNTVTVNGLNFPWWGEFKKKDFYGGAVKQYEGNSEEVKLVLEKDFPSLGVKFNRSLELVRGESLKITDTLRSQSENKYEQWFHLAEEFEYSGEMENGKLKFDTDKFSVIIHPPVGAEVLVVKGQEEPFVQGWVSYKEKKITPRWSFGFIKDSKITVSEVFVEITSY